MAPTVAIFGATGETGSSIVNALLDQDSPHSIPPSNIITLTRPASVSKAVNTSLSARGVTIRQFSIDSPQYTLVSALSGIDILISCVGDTTALLDQIPLATAAKEAGVKRFFPSAWLPLIPPGGVNVLRDLKEEVYAHVKAIGLPFTVLDVGWWYQMTIPKLPSGRVNYAATMPATDIFGSGAQDSGLTDLRDIGKYVARAVHDDRTVNKYVFVYNELRSQLDTFALWEKLSGETIPRHFLSREELEAEIAENVPILQSAGMDHNKSPEAGVAVFKAVTRQYGYSWGVKGDNTPARARELGYVTSKDLWPEMDIIKYEDFLGEVLQGGAKAVYSS